MTTIFVLNEDGKRLMPSTRPGRIRHLLKEGKAKIVSHHPFAVQLTYEAQAYTQPIEFCEDTGDHHVGISIKSEKKEYVSEEYRPLQDEKQRHDNRRKLRRTRRNKLRYRKARFNNRKRKSGWLPPSIEHKKEVNLHPYKKYFAVCPITSAVFEVGSFDTQRLQAIEEGKELPEGKDYQKGPKYNLATLREAVFTRDRYTCQFCGRDVTDGAILHVHHALFWKGRHGNQLNELVTCCEKCHTPENHKRDYVKDQKPDKEHSNGLNGYTPKKFVEMAGAATMNMLRWKIVNEAKELDSNVCINTTYGAYTKAKRTFLGLEKSHVNDAYAMGSFHPDVRANSICWQKKRRNDRILEEFYDAQYIDTRTNKKEPGKVLFSGRTKRNKNLCGENLRKYRGKKVVKGHCSRKRKTVDLLPGDIVSFKGENRIVFGTHTQKNGSVNVQFKNPPEGTRKSANVKRLVIVKKIPRILNNGWVLQKM